jgi:hypothetical protein
MPFKVREVIAAVDQQLESAPTASATTVQPPVANA